MIRVPRPAHCAGECGFVCAPTDAVLAVDDEEWGAVGAHSLCTLLFGFYLRLVPTRSKHVAGSGLVQSDLTGELDELVDGPELAVAAEVRLEHAAPRLMMLALGSRVGEEFVSEVGGAERAVDGVIAAEALLVRFDLYGAQDVVHLTDGHSCVMAELRLGDPFDRKAGVNLERTVDDLHFVSVLELGYRVVQVLLGHAADGADYVGPHLDLHVDSFRYRTICV